MVVASRNEGENIRMQSFVLIRRENGGVLKVELMLKKFPEMCRCVIRFGCCRFFEREDDTSS